MHHGPLVIAEDEATLRSVVAQTLEDCGFTVVAVENGLDALDQAKLHPDCRLLVSDVRMAAMDGFTLGPVCRM